MAEATVDNSSGRFETDVTTNSELFQAQALERICAVCRGLRLCRQIAGHEGDDKRQGARIDRHEKQHDSAGGIGFLGRPKRPQDVKTFIGIVMLVIRTSLHTSCI